MQVWLFSFPSSSTKKINLSLCKLVFITCGPRGHMIFSLYSRANALWKMHLVFFSFFDFFLWFFSCPQADSSFWFRNDSCRVRLFSFISRTLVTLSISFACFMFPRLCGVCNIEKLLKSLRPNFNKLFRLLKTFAWIDPSSPGAPVSFRFSMKFNTNRLFYTRSCAFVSVLIIFFLLFYTWDFFT